LQARKEELVQARTKADRANLRANNVERDMQSLRLKIQTMLDKSLNDDKLVDTLKSEYEKVQKSLVIARKQIAQLQSQPVRV